ncbi:MAG: F0F1 ATP synthase subunit B [Anaerovoracaceae bacterium]
MELGHAPIIEFSWTLLFNIITVLVLFLILKKFFFEKVHNFMESRSNDIKDSFDNAESVNRRADEKLEEYNSKLRNIEDERMEIIRKAKETADLRANSIISYATEQAIVLRRNTEEALDKQKEKAFMEMQDEISIIAMMAAEKILQREIEKTEEHNKIIEDLLKEAGTKKWNH